MCKNMDLDPQAAVIDYKLSTEPARDAPREISSEEDYALAMESILEKTQNARTKTHTLILQNLVRVLTGSFVSDGPCLNICDCLQRPNQYTATSKQKRGHGETVATDARLHERYVKELQNQLQCKRHPRTYCLVWGSGPDVARHEELDEPALSYWARMIVGYH